MSFHPKCWLKIREMGPLISGKSRLVKYYSIWPDDMELYHHQILMGDILGSISFPGFEAHFLLQNLPVKNTLFQAFVFCFPDRVSFGLFHLKIYFCIYIRYTYAILITIMFFTIILQMD